MKSRNTRLMTVALIAIMIVAAFAPCSFAAGKTVTISKYNAPTTLEKGKSFSIKGTIKSSKKKIKRVEIGIVKKSSGKWTKYKYDKKVNAKSFNIKKADSKLKFGKLAAGEYYYRIYAHTSDKKAHLLLNKPFTVKGSGGASSSGAVLMVKASACTYPVQLPQGKGMGVRGTVAGSDKITKIIIGVVDASSNAWTSVKYTNSSVNSYVFDVGSADSALKFGTLPMGTYYYRIIATARGKEFTVLDQRFAVVDKSKEAVTKISPTAVDVRSAYAQKVVDNACAWAVKIANDNSFHYGNGKHSHHEGCYFCGTQPSIKKKYVVNYQKTYCCNTFVTAAFAHGAGEPNMLKRCKRADSMWVTDYPKSKLFISLGHPAKSTLMKGDVLCAKSHVVIYLGDGKIAEAGSRDDGKPGSSSWKNSIRVTSLSSSRYKGFNAVYRYVGN